MCLAAQLCPTLWDPMDCSLPGSILHGDSPDKNTGLGCYVLHQGIFPTQGLNPGLPQRWLEWNPCLQLAFVLLLKWESSTPYLMVEWWQGSPPTLLSFIWGLPQGSLLEADAIDCSAIFLCIPCTLSLDRTSRKSQPCPFTSCHQAGRWISWPSASFWQVL